MAQNDNTTKATAKMTDSVGLPPETVAVDLTRHERRILLEALELEVRDTVIVSKRIGGPGIYAFCFECGNQAECRADIIHHPGCGVAPLWALYDRLSREWSRDEETPPPSPLANPVCD